jgi:uncharacterized protein (TIGR04255 family)
MTGIDQFADFERPPVVEVVAAVRFADLPSNLALGLGEYWSSVLRNDLPRLSEQPPYEPPIEKLDKPAPQPGINLQLTNLPASPRLWATNTSGDELVQLQRNWFACNWRKVAPGAEYDRWPQRRSRFMQRYKELEQWATERGVALSPDQCEVTYINHIYPDSLWSSHAEAYRIFAPAAASLGTEAIIQEDFSWRARYLLNDASGNPVGRLHAAAFPAFSKEDEGPLFVLELTARGYPRMPGLDEVVRFLDLGREAVVRMFIQLTTAEARQTWGQR